MNLRTTLLLAVVLIVLAVVATVMEKNRKQNRAPSAEALFPQLELDAVDGMSITKGNIAVELAKEGETWVVVTEENKEADPALVERILEKLEGLTTSDLVSKNPNSHETYEVNDLGVDIKLSQGGETTAQFVVGKPGPDFMSSYIRPTDGDETYRVPVYLRSDVDRGGRTWRDQTILKIDTADLESYTYTPEGEYQITVTQDEAGTWRVTEPDTLQTEAKIMSVIVESLASIKATGFADTVDVATTGLDAPNQILEIREKSGTTHVLEIGNENEARQAYTRLRGEEDVYLVPMGRWNTVFRKLDEVAPPALNGKTGTDG